MIVRLIIGALMIGAVYSVVGIGYSVIYRASGLMSLCQGDMLMFGAFLGLFFNKSLGLPYCIAVYHSTHVLIGYGNSKIPCNPAIEKGIRICFGHSVHLGTLLRPAKHRSDWLGG